MRLYITTTLPYVNADPHVGHALEFVHADAHARFARMEGKDVFFNIGTDEHGQKIYERAIKAGKSPKEYSDFYSVRFRVFADSLNISYTNFIRTTDQRHIDAAQEFWKQCLEKGDIYKKTYTAKYCVGCELEKTDSELIDGKCPDHPTTTIQTIAEENYFFRFSKYQAALLELYKGDFVIPKERSREIKSFVSRGLTDFSISRLKEKMPWGVPVPGDPEHVMYVWFEALVSYVAAIGWPEDMESFNKWWPVVQFCGKDNLRAQTAMWQAMLSSVGLPASERVVVHGFVTSGGQKMSKSVGNVVDPAEIVTLYGADALRHYLIWQTPAFEDGDLTLERFHDTYNAELANGIGNLASRILTMAETHLTEPVKVGAFSVAEFSEYQDGFRDYDLKKAGEFVWGMVKELDERIAKTEPFKLVKSDAAKGQALIKELVHTLGSIAHLLAPLLPDTSNKILSAIAANKKPETLFPRK